MYKYLFILLLVGGCATPSWDVSKREPSSLQGNFSWLDKVERDFDRIASEAGDRSIASSGKNIVWASKKRWSFFYKNKHFFCRLDGKDYPLQLTNLESTDYYSFSVKGGKESFLTLSVHPSEGRGLASSQSTCFVELSFWDEKRRKYREEGVSLSGSRCLKMLKQLQSYVP